MPTVSSFESILGCVVLLQQGLLVEFYATNLNTRTYKHMHVGICSLVVITAPVMLQSP